FQPLSTVINNVSNTLNLEEYLSSLESGSAKRNIKKALKYMEDNGIVFEVRDKLSSEEIASAYSLFEAVSSNSKFVGRTLSYYQKLQETLSDKTIWYTMKKDNEFVLVNLAIKDISTKSSNDLYVGKKMELEEGAISYALKYLSFKYLAQNGYTYYDHWGVYLDPKSPKYGFSEFKMKFGGKLINFFPIFAYSKYIPTSLLNIFLKIFIHVSF
ncbi:MAG: hypothetical protein WCK31_04410, partial [bacterium]